MYFVFQGNMNSNHWIGANRLGTSASNSVVDPNAKVFGTDNLFVVDVSHTLHHIVFPKLTVWTLLGFHCMFLLVAFREMQWSELTLLSRYLPCPWEIHKARSWRQQNKPLRKSLLWLVDPKLLLYLLVVLQNV